MKKPKRKQILGPDWPRRYPSSAASIGLPACRLQAALVLSVLLVSFLTEVTTHHHYHEQHQAHMPTRHHMQHKTVPDHNHNHHHPHHSNHSNHRNHRNHHHQRLFDNENKLEFVGHEQHECSNQTLSHGETHPLIGRPGRRSKRHHLDRAHERARASKRQAVDMVKDRLHILESLDEQLRAFAETAELAQQQRQTRLKQKHAAQSEQSGPQEPVGRQSTSPASPTRDFHCHLRLHATELRESGMGAHQQPGSNSGDDFCLRNRTLLAEIPPLMLNLYRQLLPNSQEASLNFSETVQLMPYKAQTVRSFRQPKLGPPSQEVQVDHEHDHQHDHQEQHEHEQEADGSDKRANNTKGEGGAQRLRRVGGVGVGNVVVELSVLDGSEQVDKQGHDYETTKPLRTRSHETEAAEGLANYLVSGSDRFAQVTTSDSEGEAETNSACDFRQRLVAAYKRDEICFWFRLDEGLRSLIAIDRDGRRQREAPRERLVEAELHVFKLFPQLLPNRLLDFHSTPTDQSDSSLQLQQQQHHHHQQKHSTNYVKTNKFAQETAPTTNSSAHIASHHQQAQQQQQFQPINRATTANSYHLRTNLLEVSLYQILPSKKTAQRNAADAQQHQAQTVKAQDEFPLRLLDIRRIDLNSNGWETFYVKRAVEDWLRDPHLNLGLVIKAKSMFDEPIRVGLIRFADAYDHLDQAPGEQSMMKLSKQSQAMEDFNLSHQPLLVIYTTPTDETGAR